MFTLYWYVFYIFKKLFFLYWHKIYQEQKYLLSSFVFICLQGELYEGILFTYIFLEIDMKHWSSKQFYVRCGKVIQHFKMYLTHHTNAKVLIWKFKSIIFRTSASIPHLTYMLFLIYCMGFLDLAILSRINSRFGPVDWDKNCGVCMGYNCLNFSASPSLHLIVQVRLLSCFFLPYFSHITQRPGV